ncbi:MAG: hypothetical protein MJZ68_06850 [archaeon]|nr:hypothetical protein [archaeon]
MKVSIIYDKGDLALNGFFAERLVSCFRENGHDAEMMLSDSVDYDVDLMVFRNRDPLQREEAEDRGVVPVNCSRTARIGNDKGFCYREAERMGIPVLPNSLLKDVSDPVFPLVVKSCGGHGGHDVRMVRTMSEWNSVLEVCDPGTTVVQKVAKDLGRDQRVFVLDGKVFGSVMRRSDTDFRANFSLGGYVEKAEVSDEQASIIGRIISEYPMDLAGVDFVFSDGRPYLNEVEDVVGTRILYGEFGIDMAKVFVDMLCSKYLRCR